MKILIFITIVLSSLFSNFSQADDNAPEVAYYPPSTWGQPPAKVTKELVCLQYPRLCEAKDDGQDPAVQEKPQMENAKLRTL
jgi:hypothetical protein